MGDLGYIGCGMLTARRKPPGQDRPARDRTFNQSIGKVRSAVERAIAHLKDWKTSPLATAAPSPPSPTLPRPSPPSPSTRPAGEHP
ncbi:transposase family protein [Streptomyces netropsis]|uniref:transposase family protein n=1 Tax=Streptomyces netropsis TaxID=55404 RepID=UPI0037B899A9